MTLRFLMPLLVALLLVPGRAPCAAEPKDEAALFRRENLIAWCIVPFDAKKRGPEERAAMLARLGFKHFAYDFREEHVPTFDAEIEACRRHGVALDAWWFPKTLDARARHILDVCRKHDLRPQLWVSGGGAPTTTPAEQQERIAQEAARIRPIAEAAAAQGMKVGLYNHGGWFGEPENQLALIEHLQLPNVGIVYNLHHGHDHLPRFAAVLPKLLPHLLALNLNGMVPDGDKQGRKILQLGQGTLDLELLRTIRDSGYRGPIGILGHTQDDAEARLQDNLDGLDWLLAQLDGQPAGPRPQPRTPVPAAQPAATATPATKTTAAELPRGRAPLPSAGAHLQPVDPRLKAVLVDRSPEDVYLGVKADADGRLFVGGREAVFLFEPRPDGDDFLPRRELLRFPQNSIIMGLEFRGDDLYVLTANALYVVPQGRVRREDLRPERILWGLPLDLHVSFHCLAWGPDGDLYVTHGDPLLQYGQWDRPDHWGHWTLYCGRAQTPLPYTGQGAVLRMKPDATNVQVVARGLRGPVGLAFDRAGNLFTNDNDHESRADQYAPSRLLHVVDGIDFAWPRGWAASKSPDRYDLIEPMCDLGRGVPCDLTFYDRPLLAAQLGGRLLMCRWDRHSVTAYRPVRKGATFSAAEETVATGDENCRPVGLAADAAGRLFVTALYMTGNMAAPECASDLVMIVPADAAAPIAAPSSPSNELAAVDVADPLAAAQSDDPYRRQLGVAALAEAPAADGLFALLKSTDEPTRLAGVLAIGRRLTVPDIGFVPPADLPLFYPKGSSYFHRQHSFYGATDTIDLADLGRVGSFTIAQGWAATVRTPEQERLFAALLSALADDSDRIRLQAAYFLSLLRDERCEAAIAAAQRDVLVRRLQAAAEFRVFETWCLGPWGGEQEAASERRPEQGHLDLAAEYAGRAWQADRLDAPSSGTAQETAGTYYFYFRVQSGIRQTALLSALPGTEMQVWQNEVLVPATSREAGATRALWIVDLQPGSNDFLLRIDARSADVRFQAHGRLELLRPERLDSSLLAERLREAAAQGDAQAAAAEFAAVDWTRPGAEGDASAGRKLFASLGCAKCHAVAAEQKSAGAPSLFEAKRRFTVPHLVESVLLPSRQVAGPFRAQTFVTSDGRTLTGLVTGETADAVELLQTDAVRTTLAKSEIEERATTQLSPMPAGLVKSPDELRHLLAYLLSESPLPP